MNQQDVQRLTALFQAGRLQEAMSQAESLRAKHPTVPFLYNLMGAIQARMGNHKAAVGYYGVAVQLKPDFAEAYSNMGVSQKEAGMHTEAITSLRRAVALEPGSGNAQLNLGTALAEVRNFPEAIICFRRAALANPNSTNALLNLANALGENDEHASALETIDKVLELEPDLAAAVNKRGQVLNSMGEFEESLRCLERAFELDPENIEALSSQIFVMAYINDTTPAELRKKSEQFGELALKASAAFARDIPIQGDVKHFGFISSDFGRHPVGHFMHGILPAMIELLAGRDQQLTLYSNRPKGREDTLTAEFQQMPCAWVDVSTLSDRALADKVRQDKVDVLVDLNGHTSGQRLEALAARCAPMQMSWMGYFATTGIAAMDYFVGDQWVAPAEEADHFVERIAAMPNGYLPFMAPPISIEVGPLPALENGHVTFGSLNNLPKMGPDVSALWSKVLLAVPGSRLLLKTPQLDDKAIAASVIERFTSHGIEAERLELVGRTDREGHLAAYNQIDVALEPFPYPGGMTSYEANWMGVPVITLRGSNFLSHVGESIANNLDLGDWIAKDGDDYVAKAEAAAADLKSLAALRATLRERVLASPACDAKQFSQDFLDTVDALWERDRT